MMRWSRISFKFYAETTTNTLQCVWECRVGPPEPDYALRAQPHMGKAQDPFLVGLGLLVLSLAPCWCMDVSISFLVSTRDYQ